MKRHQHTFFASDHHFCHEAIIRMCGRPFADADDMNRSMIQAWNSVVRPSDVVWHLGDFAHRGKPADVKSIFNALNGIKNLVIGNHDKQATKQLPWAEQIGFKHIVIDGVQVNLSHYGMRVWPGIHRGAVMLYGHSHGTLPGSRNTIDVGVDNVGFVPQTFAQLQARMALLPRLAFDTGRVIDDRDETLEIDADEGFQP